MSDQQVRQRGILTTRVLLLSKLRSHVQSETPQLANMKAKIHAVANCAYAERERHEHEVEESKRSRLNARIPSPWP